MLNIIITNSLNHDCCMYELDDMFPSVFKNKFVLHIPNPPSYKERKSALRMELGLI